MTNRIKKIDTFWLVLNDVCNNRCKFCYLRDVGLKNPKNMDLGYAKDIVLKMKQSGASNCILIGGEPTLYNDLFELIIYINKMGLETTLVTNGRLMANDQYAGQLKKAGLTRVVVSVEGWDKKSHNEITQAMSYEETKKGVLQAIKHEIKTETLTTITKNNIDMIEKIYFQLVEWRVGSIDFNFAIPQLNENGAASWEFTPDLELAVKKIESLYGLVKSENKQKFYLTGTIPICLFDEKIAEKMISDGWANFGCHMYEGQGVVFDAEGSLLPCTHFAGYPLGVKNIGNDGKSKIKNFVDYLNGGLPKKFRQELWRFPSKKCISCQYWGYCVGGCPLLWLEKDPSVIIQ